MKNQVFFPDLTEFSRISCRPSTYGEGANCLGAYGRGHGMSSKRKVDLGNQQPQEHADTSFPIGLECLQPIDGRQIEARIVSIED